VLFNGFDLLKQLKRINDNTVADYAAGSRMEYTGWYKMQDYSFSVKFEGMSGVGPTLVPGNKGGFVAEQVNNLAFALVAPLGSDNYSNWHD
jgi:hypothetical protein